MRNFKLVAQGVKVLPLCLELQRNPQLWGRDGERKYPDGSPHTQMDDIWVRYNDRGPFDRGERPFSEFNHEHDSVWYPAAAQLPSARQIALDLMAHVRGERLGGVLITRLAHGGVIDTHVDHGWHAEYYDKYYVAVQTGPGAEFQFDVDANGQAGEVIRATTGDIYWFRNDVPHAVVNQSGDERIAMIICIRHDR